MVCSYLRYVQCTALRYVPSTESDPFLEHQDDPELLAVIASMGPDDIRRVLWNVQGEGEENWRLSEPAMVLILQICGRVLSMREVKQLLEQFGYVSGRETVIRNQAVAQALQESKNPWAYRWVPGGRPHKLGELVQSHVQSGAGMSPGIILQIDSGLMPVDAFRMMAAERFGEMHGKKEYYSFSLLIKVFHMYGRVLSRDEVSTILEHSTHYDTASGLIMTALVEEALVESGNPYAFCFCRSLQVNPVVVKRTAKADLNALRFVPREFWKRTDNALVITGDIPRAIWALQGATASFPVVQSGPSVEWRAVKTKVSYKVIAFDALVQLLQYWTSGTARIQHAQKADILVGLRGMAAARRGVDFTHTCVTPSMIEGLLVYFNTEKAVHVPKVLPLVLRPSVLRLHFTASGLAWRVEVPLNQLYLALESLISSYRCLACCTCSGPLVTPFLFRFVAMYMNTMMADQHRVAGALPGCFTEERGGVGRKQLLHNLAEFWLNFPLYPPLCDMQTVCEQGVTCVDVLEGPFRCFLDTSRPDPEEFVTGLLFMSLNEGERLLYRGEECAYFSPWGMMLTRYTQRMLRPVEARPAIHLWVHMVADNAYLHDVILEHGRWVSPDEANEFVPGFYLLVASAYNPVGLNTKNCKVDAELCETHAMLTNKLRGFKEFYSGENTDYSVYRLDKNAGDLPLTIASRTMQAMELTRVPHGAREVACRLMQYAGEAAEKYAHGRWRGPFGAVIQMWMNRIAVADGREPKALYPWQPTPRYEVKKCQADLTRMVERNTARMDKSADTTPGRNLMTLMTKWTLENDSRLVLDFWERVLAHLAIPSAGVRRYHQKFVYRGDTPPWRKAAASARAPLAQNRKRRYRQHAHTHECTSFTPHGT